MKLSKMSKEDLELLSYTNIAKLYLEENKKTMNTADLFHQVCSLLELSEQEYQAKIADFFQSLTTSKEFILLDNGEWDLKTNHKVKIDMDELYEDKDEEDIDEDLEDDEMTEEDEYNSIDDEEEYAEDDLSDLTILNEDELDGE
ncbi:MAG: DNA-directed RNA polymerase subunit delta [Bacilli bacterium]